MLRMRDKAVYFCCYKERICLLFNSLEYLFFLPLVVILYYTLPTRWRWLLLLGASYFFYAWWKVEYLVLILLSTLTDYIASNSIAASKKQQIKKLWLSLSILCNLGLLFLFKYLKLFLPPKDIMHLSIKAAEQPFLGELYYALYLIIPVGISFYTFQTMSYTFDVYRGRIKAEKHLGKFALFVSFFPQLVAGPIERYANLRPQLDAQTTLLYNNIRNGLRLILFGFFLKLCIADNLAQIVDPVYETPLQFNRLNIFLGTMLFGFQIYGDFAGYSLIAQGSALLLGIKLMDNFKNPYLSTSITEFWQRWHISLSTWFRDYLYIPLGGNRVRALRWALNILLVFAISGFWHGAQWTFLIWGGIHGLLYLGEKTLKGIRLPLLWKKIAGWIITFSMVSVAWVFFRAGNLDLMATIWQGIVNNNGTEYLIWSPVISFMLILFLLFEFILYNGRFDRWIGGLHAFWRWIIYSLLIFSITALGGAANHPFIYFQF